MVKVVLAASLAALLVACSHTRGGSYCQIAAPIYPTEEDVEVISDGLVTQILTHNSTGEELCGWGVE